MDEEFLVYPMDSGAIEMNPAIKGPLLLIGMNGGSFVMANGFLYDCVRLSSTIRRPGFICHHQGPRTVKIEIELPMIGRDYKGERRREK